MGYIKLIKGGEKMGLLGPSWTWDEIQKKDAIMNDLKRENDRILEEQRRMIRKNIDSLEVDNYRTGDSVPVAGIGAAILGISIPLAFIMMQFLLSTVELGNTEDPLSMEITIMFVGSLIACGCGLIAALNTKEGKLMTVAGTIFGLSAIIAYLGVLIYDICFNGAFDSFWKTLQFLFAAVLNIFTAGLWALATTIIGTVIVLILSFGISLIYKFIKTNYKKKRILNSDLYKEILNKTKSNEKDIHYITISTIDIEMVTDTTTKINYAKKGFSSLDKNGIIALGILLKKELSNYKMRVDDNLVILRNEDYDHAQRELAKEKEKEEQEEIKRKKKEKKEKIKTGKDW